MRKTLALVAALLATPALADTIPRGGSPVPPVAQPQRVDQPSSWTGFTFSVSGGVANDDVKLGIPGGSIDGLNSTGAVLGAGLGVRYQLPASALVFGARGGYQWYYGNFEITPTGGPALFKAGLTDGWYADGTLGYAAGTALPYIGLGYTKMHTSASVFGTGVSSPDLEGIRYIAGVEFQLPRSLAGWLTPTIALEYVYTDYRQVSL